MVMEKSVATNTLFNTDDIRSLGSSIIEDNFWDTYDDVEESNSNRTDNLINKSKRVTGEYSFPHKIQSPSKKGFYLKVKKVSENGNAKTRDTSFETPNFGNKNSSYTLPLNKKSGNFSNSRIVGDSTSRSGKMNQFSNRSMTNTYGLASFRFTKPKVRIFKTKTLSSVKSRVFHKTK